jgi:SAM-dependent methyltransferase
MPVIARGVWDDVAASDAEPLLWRRHSDQVNVSLLDRWLGDQRFTSVLKTDLFDEHVAAGLYPALRRRAERVTAVDLSEDVVQRVRERCAGIDARVADVLDLPFEAGAFDLVVSNSTLDHFASRAQIGRAALELRRVLSPGGRLVVTLDNLANPLVALRAALPSATLRRLRLVAYPVGASLGPRGTREMLRRAGFELLEMTAIMHVPRLPAVVAARLLDRRDPAAGEPFLRAAGRLERLDRLPTRYLTGYFVAALARRPDGP